MPETEQADRPHHLRAAYRTVDGVRIVTLHGEIDHDAEDTFRDALLGTPEAAPTRIVADLSGVSFMDSTGVNVLIATHLLTQKAQGWVRIAGAQQPIQRILQVTGVDAFIPCHPTTEQAVTA
ncbi:STAS domain-containing protein [Actinospica acidiphila]|uniref:Anti-sigma factor antagonist n=1 Tax=Streptomyces erythrogriseus TaxID=284027 RepID=A0ABN3XEW7_9ACTN|nr:STAS domain-containing protein [Streptomyces sp. BSE7-9]MBJ6641945.1 STAS domain-containing protein [Streptomyces sp. BSE7-9]NEA82426.1 STAS domain-containing protein [Actinospica acidiphila]PWE11036.1 anti-sigma factor antagonist [Streptomyces sp. BSE7F]